MRQYEIEIKDYGFDVIDNLKENTDVVEFEKVESISLVDSDGKFVIVFKYVPIISIGLIKSVHFKQEDETEKSMVNGYFKLVEHYRGHICPE